MLITLQLFHLQMVILFNKQKIGWVNEASAPHLVVSAFKNLAAIGFGAGIIFDQIKVSASAPAP